MPFLIFVLLYALGALIFTTIAIILNKNYKWVTLKELNDINKGGELKCALIALIILWPLSITGIIVLKCISLFINFCKNYIPKK